MKPKNTTKLSQGRNGIRKAPNAPGPQPTGEITPSSLEEAGKIVGRAGSYLRMAVLMGMINPVARQDWFRLLGGFWDCCDNVITWERFLEIPFSTATREELNLMMTAEELARWEALPDPITAWRGCYPINKRGFSYSLSEQIARGFPNFNRYQIDNRRPILLRVSIPKALAVIKLGRDEEEVIATRRNAVKILSETFISFRRKKSDPAG